MKNNFWVLVWMSVLFITAGCNDTDGVFSVRRRTIDVGQANVGDSVSASFTFRNNTGKRLAINFIPECDCTTLDIESMKLGPHECGQLKVKVAVKSAGDFIRYVYAQAAGSEEFLAVAIKGRTK